MGINTKYINSSIDPVQWDFADKLMAKLPLEIHAKIVPKALRKAIEPVVKKAQEYGREHDSDLTGTRLKQSKKVQAERAGLPHLWQTVTNRTQIYDNWTVMALAGPSWPAGNLINFWGDWKNHILWGGAYHGKLPPFDFLERAANDTASEQAAVLLAVLKAEVTAFLVSNPAPQTGNAGLTP